MLDLRCPVQFTTTALQPVENLNDPGKKIWVIANVIEQEQLMDFNRFHSIELLRNRYKKNVFYDAGWSELIKILTFKIALRGERNE